MQKVCDYTDVDDSTAYSAGMDAGLCAEFFPCPFDAGSRAEMLWYSGRSDILYAQTRTDMALLDDGD